MSWSNGTAAPQTYEQSYTTGFRSTTGTELSASISLAPSFNGISVWAADASFKTFSSEEFSEESHTTTVNVPPHSDVFFYHRRYTFWTEVYFTLDAWNDLWIAGSLGGYNIQRAIIESTIYTRDYVTRERALSGTEMLNFQSQARQPWFGNWVRQFQNLTGRAQNTLRGLGIDGSQTNPIITPRIA